MPTARTFFSLQPDEVSPEEEARFFGALKAQNGTFKRTESGRFAAVDAELVTHLDAAGGTIRDALDLGISSGITTLELAHALRSAGHPVRMTGTDRLLEARLVGLPLGCGALVEPSGHVLQYEVMGLPIRPWRRRLDFATGMVALRWLIERLLHDEAVRRSRSPRARSVMLVSPRLSRATDIRLLEDDLTRHNPRFAGRFDLVRAANILNRHYLAGRDLAQAIENVITYLRGPGAWLLIVRTIGDAQHHGTLFRMGAGRRLEVVSRHGDGSDVEAQILECAAELAQRGSSPASRERCA